MKDAYRTNERKEARGERTNRRLDYILYAAPLRRLAYLLLLIAPLTLSARVAFKMTGKWEEVLAFCIAHVLITMLFVIPLVPVLDNREVSRRSKVIMVAYGPLSALMLVVHWVVFGTFIPKFCKIEKKKA